METLEEAGAWPGENQQILMGLDEGSSVCGRWGRAGEWSMGPGCATGSQCHRSGTSGWQHEAVHAQVFLSGCGEAGGQLLRPLLVHFPVGDQRQRGRACGPRGDPAGPGSAALPPGPRCLPGCFQPGELAVLCCPSLQLLQSWTQGPWEVGEMPVSLPGTLQGSPLGTSHPRMGEPPAKCPSLPLSTCLPRPWQGAVCSAKGPCQDTHNIVIGIIAGLRPRGRSAEE